MKFTVAVPAYKSEHLEECLRSVLAQTFRDFELIVVDDASPGPVRETVSRFGDPRVSYCRNETNCGALNVVDNWNKCLALAKGEYFCLMGDDDVMGGEYLAEMDRLSRLHPDVCVLHGRTMEIDGSSRKTVLCQAWPELQSVYDLIWHKVANFRDTFISDFTFKTECLRSMGGFFKLPLAWGSDDITAYKAAAPHGIAATNKVVFYYRSHGASISSSGDTAAKLRAVGMERQWLESFIAAASPADEEEAVLCRMIRARLGRYADYRRALEVCRLWRGGRYRELLRLWLKRRRHSLTAAVTAMGILMAIGNRPRP